MKITITKDEALDIMDSDDVVFDEELGRARWAIERRMVFKRDGKLWQAVYRRGTGDEGETPFEYVKEVTCDEVVAVEKTVVDYRVAP